jgi:hypothetical protein
VRKNSGRPATRHTTSRQARAATVAVLLAGTGVFALINRRASAHALHWTHEHWLNAVAVTAGATILVALIPLVTWLVDRHRVAQTLDHGADAIWQSRTRRAMLRRVHHMWISGVLKPSLAGRPRLAIDLERRPEVVAGAPRQPGRSSATMPPAKSILDVFDDADGQLLLLGNRGAGKTTLLLELADGLLKRAEHDPDYPIPVVASLASWSPSRQPFEEWLAREIAASYRVLEETARAWLAQDSLALLLDGFDEAGEAHWAACAAAINDYRRVHGLVPIVVCGLTQAFQDLAGQLDFEEALELMTPTDARIAAYLQRLEEAGTPLADLRAALGTDETLRELIRSPLMLHVVITAYRDHPDSVLRQSESTERRRTRLWDTYVDQMFEQRPLHARYGYTTMQAEAWLSWLARNLRQRDETEFRPEWLTPEWLPEPVIRRRNPFSRWSIRLLEICYPAPLVPMENPYRNPLIRAEIASLPREGLLGLREADLVDMIQSAYRGFPLLIGPPGAAVSAGLIIGLYAGPLPGLVSSLAAGVIAFAIAGIFYGLVMKWEYWRAYRFPGRVAGEPYAEIWRSAAQGISTGLTAALLFGLLSGEPFGLLFGSLAGLVSGLVVGLWFGLWFGLTAGGFRFLQNYTLRVLLARAGVAPMRYETFLDAMTERLLLHHNGKSYLFSHQLLCDHFADRIPGEALGDETAGRL